MVTQQQTQFKILLIGDRCKDVYQYGYVDRISPEAPVPVFVKTTSSVKYGMVENVAVNLFALGCEVKVISGNESIKTRLIDARSKQQLVRIDEDAYSEPVTIKDSLDGYDAIVISDYNKGVVSYDLIDYLRSTTKAPIFIDTKKTDLHRFEGCFVKINSLEYGRAETACTDLIVTMGDKGASYKGQVYPAVPSEVVDVCGAGDTFLSALAFEYLRSGDIVDAIKFANKASAISVRHTGCFAPSLGEIE